MTSHLRRIAPIAIAIFFTVSAFATPVKPARATNATTLSSEKDKLSYAIGMQIAASISNSIRPVKDDVDVSTVLRAINTSLTGGKTALTIPEAQATLKAFGQKMQARDAAQQKVTAQAQQAVAQKNLAEGAAFLAANTRKPGVKTTASGLEYQVVQVGKGPKPKATDTVTVNYAGTLLDGTEFDSSAKHGGPSTFQVGGVIPGWTEGLQLMNVGSKFVFWVPGKLAYGTQPGAPGGPNSMLKFEVELVSIGAK